MNDLRAERPKRRSDVLFRQLDDDWVLYDPVSDKLHVLNLTGALLWSHCTGDYTTEEIANEVGGAFDPPIPGPGIQTDIESAIRTLAGEGLFE